MFLDDINRVEMDAFNSLCEIHPSCDQTYLKQWLYAFNSLCEILKEYAEANNQPVTDTFNSLCEIHWNGKDR